jgi:hypothetical protein
MSMAEQPEALAPNPDDMRQHLTLLFGSAREYDDGLIEIAIATNKGWQGQLFGVDEIDKAVAFAAERNAQGHNTYIGVALRDPDTPPFGRASDRDHYATTAIGGDLDTGEASAAAPSRTRGLPPSFIVCTGQHPHKRLQPFWLLDEPVTDPKQHRSLFGGVADSLSGDRAITNPGRVMRLAGSIAWPTKPGRIPELTHLVPLKYEPRTYSAEEIARAYPASDKVTAIDTTTKNDPIERVATGTLGLGAETVTDGREAYMRDTILAVLIQFIGENGASPSEQELFDAAWPQYAAHVDLSRPGRGKAEMAAKIRSTLRRFERGQLRSLPDIDAAVERWRAKQAKEKAAGPSAAEWSAEKPAPIALKAALESTTILDQTVPISSPWDSPPEGIPAREWIIRGLMIRKHISILVAPGGSGKSLLSAQWAIALALGMPWGGWTPLKPEKVLLINAEDDHDEMMRRIHAACKVMQVNPRDLIGRLFLADDPRSIVVAKTSKEKVVVATPLADAIKQTVEANGIGVVIVDPFAETFEGDENSNSEVKWAAAIWRAVARDTHSSVMLVHHTPKYAKGMAGDADAARGAGALVNSARIVSTLFTMTDEEATLFDIKADEAHRYVRFDDAKANLTLITGKARWFEKVSHELPNGDSVGVLKPWKPPGVFDGVSIETITSILQTLDAGRDGGKYLYNVKAGPDVTPAWGGSVIMDAIGCDRAKATKIMAEWAKSGLLVQTEYTSEHRKPKTGLRVDFTKRPGVE